MNRRNLLAAAGTVPPALLAGCLNRAPFMGVSHEDLPEWPDEPTESAATSYATRYRAATAFNERLDERGEDDFKALAYGCEGAFEAEVTTGFVVAISGSWAETLDGGLFGSDLASEGSLPPKTLLVNEAEVIKAALDHDDFEQSWDPPFSTRGITVVNFAPESHQVDVTIQNVDNSELDDATLAETFALNAEQGETALEILDDPGEYEVSVSVSNQPETIHNWNVSDEPREPVTLASSASYDIALGIYVLPDGTVEIHEIPEDRITEEERVSQHTDSAVEYSTM